MSASPILIVGRKGQLAQALAHVAKEDELPNPLIFKGSADHDFFDVEATAALIREGGARAVINTAAYTNVDRAESEPEAAFRLNADMPKAIAEACKLTGASLIHISTDYVFDGTKPVGEFYTPEDEPNPINVYGQSKLAGERAVHAMLPEALIVRTSWLISDFGKNFKTTILKLSQEQEEVHVIDDRWGTPTEATNLARYLIALTSRRKAPKIIHYSTYRAMTWCNLASLISPKSVRPKRSNTIAQIHSNFASRPKNTALSSSFRY